MQEHGCKFLWYPESHRLPVADPRLSAAPSDLEQNQLLTKGNDTIVSYGRRPASSKLWWVERCVATDRAEPFAMKQP